MKDVFGLHTRTPTADEIDRGANALRDKQMAGRFTIDWKNLTKSSKKKWLDYSEAVLRAALN